MPGFAIACRVSTGNQGLSCPQHRKAAVHHSIRWNVEKDGISRKLLLISDSLSIYPIGVWYNPIILCTLPKEQRWLTRSGIRRNCCTGYTAFEDSLTP